MLGLASELLQGLRSGGADGPATGAAGVADARGRPLYVSINAVLLRGVRCGPRRRRATEELHRKRRGRTVSSFAPAAIVRDQMPLRLNPVASGTALIGTSAGCCRSESIYGIVDQHPLVDSTCPFGAQMTGTGTGMLVGLGLRSLIRLGGREVRKLW